MATPMKNSIITTVLAGVVLALASGPALSAPTRKAVKRIVNKDITRRAPALRVQGLSGPAGLAGVQGPVGPPGSIGSAAVQRFAHVLADGTVDVAQSFGITQSAVALTGGTYCFSGLPYVSVGQVTLDYLETTGNELAKFGRAGPGCEVFVRVFDRQGTPSQGGFYLMLY